ncbi:hypothetical protein [Flavobacterium sp.]|uniref:hypothetical protein n=1 Tax=Flavobacterium sp. TaxID=239 RepID=UPI002488E42A|nr:hypothetical protein [Flavobacterium sp.]MDI1315837.1 hypothetical protein [Flavobacterium sp.]
MRNVNRFQITVLLIITSLSVKAQNTQDEKLNLPGDNLNLYAVLNLFQESETLESFEKNLNAEDSKINNLDLNNDDKTDYIKVIDNAEGETHLIVLQVAINQKENQDVAVFSVSKDEDKQIQIQLIGDEELYGKDYIIEPNSGESASQGATPNPGYSSNTINSEGKTIVVEKTVVVQVQTWPVITYMYTPAYVRWRSPWYWGYYPPYWNPWRPYYWDYYYGYHSHWHSHYHDHYHNSHYYRTPLYRNNYYNRNRSQSSIVRNNRTIGNYNKTYSKPETRQDGSAEFTRKNQNSIRPSFPSKSNSGSINNTNRAVNNTKPSTKPGTNFNTRPATRPSTRPASNGNTRPTTRPATRPTNKPTVTRPRTTRPALRK